LEGYDGYPLKLDTLVPSNSLNEVPESHFGTINYILEHKI